MVVEMRINEIVDMLLKSTESGSIIWDVSMTDSKYSNSFKMTCTSEDLMTKFELPIKWIRCTSKWELEYGFSLWIRNVNLPNGVLLVPQTNNNIVKLRDLLIEIHNLKVNKDSEIILEESLRSISRNICTSVHRESKLNNIL